MVGFTVSVEVAVKSAPIMSITELVGNQMPENKDHIDLDGWDLRRAAKENRTDIARVLIERGDDIEAKDHHGRTPLYLAAECVSFDVARLLIERGADNTP
jgi:ankyrin repeat protein